MRFLTVMAMALATAAPPWSALAHADDVSGKDQILCAVVEVNFCSPGDVCDQGPPWAWNVPDFIAIDVAGKELRTTRASGENRKTPIRNLTRQDGELIVGGVEQGRAFTFVVTEKTGEATMTVAAYGEGGVAFGTCTPWQEGRP